MVDFFLCVVLVCLSALAIAATILICMLIAAIIKENFI